MGSKNKTVSFRLNEDKFARLKRLADEQNLSLSTLFRDYVDIFLSHEGKVDVIPKHQHVDRADDNGFPVKVEVPKSFVREHERIELENEHLREQLQEYKQYTTRLEDELEEHEHESADVIRLEDLDESIGTGLSEL